MALFGILFGYSFPLTFCKKTIFAVKQPTAWQLKLQDLICFFEPGRTTGYQCCKDRIVEIAILIGDPMGIRK